ncbi:hypothetical protein [Pyrobaculum sp.]|uniref:hypothetical protein n=1 Tax=Pyrobaculum sp. TaxID=2004705 RepID=UPI0031621BB9
MERVTAAAVWMWLGGLVLTLGGFAFWLVVAGVHGARGVGSVAAEVSFGGLLSAFLNLGFAQFALREIPSRGASALSAALAASTAAGLLAFAAGWALGHPYGGLYALLALISNAALTALIAAGFPRLYFASISAQAVLKLALVAARVAPLLAILASMAVSLVMALAVLLLKVGLGRPGGWDLLWRAGVSNYWSNFSTSFAISLGVILAQRSAGDAAAGAYYLAAMAALAAGGLASSLGAASIPAMVETRRDISSGGLRVALGVTVPMVVAAAGLSPVLVGVLNEELYPFYPSISAGLVSAVALSVISMASARYNVAGRWGRLALMGLVSSAALAASTALLSPALPWGPGLALALGFLPGALLGANDVGLFPSLAGLAVSAALSAVAVFAGPLWALPLAVLSLLALHLLNVVKVGDLIAVARSLRL